MSAGLPWFRVSAGKSVLTREPGVQGQEADREQVCSERRVRPRSPGWEVTALGGQEEATRQRVDADREKQSELWGLDKNLRLATWSGAGRSLSAELCILASASP